MTDPRTTPPRGMLVLDKPAGITSHTLVAQTRKRLGTRKVGHAGTLDPMATGLMLLGVGSATRMLTHLVGLDKTYEATMLLGVATHTDDAEGEVVFTAGPEAVAAVTRAQIDAEIARLRGDILQVPTDVSAIRVNGRRAHELVRAGEAVELAARPVRVDRFEVLALRREADALFLDVVVDVSSGTYVRALARDLGAALGLGGHLTALRRTRVGPFSLDEAGDRLMSAAEVARRLFAVLEVSAEEARAIVQGKRPRVLTSPAERPEGAERHARDELVAAIAPGNVLVGLVRLDRTAGETGAIVRSALNLPTDEVTEALA